MSEKSSTCWYVDTENVAGRWAAILQSKGQHDTVMLFMTNNSGGVFAQPQVIEDMLGNPKNYITIPCYTGANALDFQLVAVVAKEIEKDRRARKRAKRTHIIVSRDAGFDAAIRHWNAEGFSVKRFAPPAAVPASALANPAVEIQTLTSPSASAKMTKEERWRVAYEQILVSFNVSKDKREALLPALVKATKEPVPMNRGNKIRAVTLEVLPVYKPELKKALQTVYLKPQSC